MKIMYGDLGFIEVRVIDVEDIEGNVIGECYVPVDETYLDLIDDPLTLWASDHGFNVDDVWLAE